MAPAKKRSGVGRAPEDAVGQCTAACACETRPRSDGLCELKVWQGTMVDPAAARSGVRLLRPNLPVAKYKRWSLFGLPGHLYYLVLLSWTPLLGLFVVIYLATVVAFAVLFGLCEGSSQSDMRNYFNLSLQTLATIGFGVLYPDNTCANWVVMLESLVSMLLVSSMTGVAFVKFARPHASLIFSKVFTVSEKETGELEMRFRVVNGTRRDAINKGEVLEAGFKLILMRVEETKWREKKLCYYDLHLRTANFITLRLETEIVHVIDTSSPFASQTRADIERVDFVLVLVMAGVDQNLHDIIHKQHEYTAGNMKWGSRFDPLVKWNERRATVVVDLGKMSAVVPAPITSTTENSLREVESCCSNEESLSFMEELANVKEENQQVDLNRLHFENAGHNNIHTVSSQSSITTNHDGVEIRLIDEEEILSSESERNSALSTQTNSGSEGAERYGVSPPNHSAFGERSRSTAFRTPHLVWQRNQHHCHLYDDEELSDHPLSLMNTRIQFRNHPLSRFSNGLYYRALDASWIQLIAILVLMYYSAITLIATIMYIVPGEVVVQTSKIREITRFERIFYFCAQTISTIGYGCLSPNPDNDLVNMFVFLLVIAGTIVSTLLTGLAWAKFSMPKASTLMYSNKLLLTSFHGKRAIMFRAANNRTYGALIEGSFRLSAVILNHRAGRRETHELKLVRNVWPIVQLGNIVTHIIDEKSPLYHLPVDVLLSGDHFFVVLFTGLDTVIAENMFSKKTYHSCDILVGHQFVDNIMLDVDGLHIDLEAVNHTTFTPDTELRESGLSIKSVDSTEEYVSVGDKEFAQPETENSSPDYPSSPQISFTRMDEM